MERKRYELEADIRYGIGKESAKKLRKRGLIPAILYGGNLEKSIPLTLNSRDFEHLLSTHGENVLLDLVIKSDGGTDSKVAIIRETQWHPVTREILHADLNQVTLDEKITFRVPIVLVGGAQGVTKGGILDQVLHEMEIECLPTQVPEAIEVEVTGLDIGDNIHVRDIEVGDEVEFKADPDQVIVTIVSPTVEEVKEVEEVEELEAELVGEEEEEEESY